MDLYQQNILDHYKHPRQSGEVVGATHHCKTSNPLCGDNVELWLKLDGNKVIKAGWKGEGCVLSQAASDMLSEYLEGKTLSEIKKIDKNVLLKMVGVELGPNRLKCALLPLDAINIIMNKNSK